MEPQEQPDKSQPDPVQSGRVRKGLCRAFRAVQWTCSVLVLATLLMVFTPAGGWAIRRVVRVDPLAKADYIVVLGGDLARSVEAADLYRQGWAGKVIFSSRDDSADELAKVAEAYGLPRQAVLLDRQARTTADHPATVARLPGVDKDTGTFILVTSPLHTSRARACFVKAGYRHVIMRGPNWRMGGDLSPRAAESWLGQATNLPGFVYELAAWAEYKLRGKV